MSEHTPKWFKRQRRDGTWYAGLAEVGWNLADTCAADFNGADPEEQCDRAVSAVNAHDALVSALAGMVGRYCNLVNCGDCGFWDPEK